MRFDYSDILSLDISTLNEFGFAKYKKINETYRINKYYLVGNPHYVLKIFFNKYYLKCLINLKNNNNNFINKALLEDMKINDNFLKKIFELMVNLDEHNYLIQDFNIKNIYAYLKFFKKYFNTIIELDDSNIELLPVELLEYYDFIFIKNKYYIKNIYIKSNYTTKYYKFCNRRYSILYKQTRREKQILINQYFKEMKQNEFKNKELFNRLYNDNFFYDLIMNEKKIKNIEKIIIDKEEYKKNKKIKEYENWINMLNKFKNYYEIIYNKEDLDKFFDVVKNKEAIIKFNNDMKSRYNIVGDFHYIKNNNGQISFIKLIKRRKIIKTNEIKIENEELLFFKKNKKQNYNNNLGNITNKEIIIKNPSTYKQKLKFEKLNIKSNILIALINLIILMNGTYDRNIVYYIQKVFINKEFIEQILYKIIPYIATKNDLDKIYNNRLNYKKEKTKK